MKLALVTLALASVAADAAIHTFTVQSTDSTKTKVNDGATYQTIAANHADYWADGTHCSGCEEVANMQPNALLSCKTATTGVRINTSKTSTSSTVFNNGCKEGYFHTAGSGDTNDTCTACEAGCSICSTAAACTSAKKGYYFSANHTGTSDVVACELATEAECGAHATLKVPKTAAEACPAVKSFDNAILSDGTNATAQLTHASGGATGCKVCGNGKFPNGAGTAGCTDCTAVAGIATGNTKIDGTGTTGCTDAIITCTSSSDSQVTAASGAGCTLTGRQCAYGKVEAHGSADTCATDCEANCRICSDSTTCLGVAEGYYLAATGSGNPVACGTPATATECVDAGVTPAAGTYDTSLMLWKRNLTSAQACPATLAHPSQNSDGATANLNKIATTVIAGVWPLTYVQGAAHTGTAAENAAMNGHAAANGSTGSALTPRDAQGGPSKTRFQSPSGLSGGALCSLGAKVYVSADNDTDNKGWYTVTNCEAQDGNSQVFTTDGNYELLRMTGATALGFLEEPGADAARINFTAAQTRYVMIRANGCAPCLPGTHPKASGNGCDACPAITNAASDALPTCLADGQGGKLSNGPSGRKCAIGYFYTEANSNTAAFCTACETNCHTCSDATTCSKPNAGYYISNNDPTACTARTAAQCAAVADSNKFPIPVNTACPANGAQTAQLTDSTGCHEYYATCPATGSPAGTTAPGIFAVLAATVAAALRM